MDDNTPGPVSDRMQALLSRAVEEQVAEQRAVSTVLAELRAQVGGLGDAVRRAASEQTVGRLADEVATVVADLRTTSSLLGSRLDALTSRVQQSTADTSVPVEAATARLTALATEVADQRAVLEDLGRDVGSLATFPDALAALQRDVAGLHDRLAPLVEVRSALGDLATRTTASLDGLGPSLDVLQSRVGALRDLPDADRLRDAVVDALAGRLDALEQQASRPVVGPAELAAALATARTSLDQALGDRSATLTAALVAADRRLGQVGERLSDVGDAAGGIPALATDLTRLAARVEELQGLGAQVAGMAEGVAALRADAGSATLALGLAGLREDVEELATRVADTAAPALEETASVISVRVTDQLLEALAPRIADVVLSRVSAALVSQVSAALSPQVRLDTQEVVLAATADSERRVVAHVDESVLALAEALLRRRRSGRSAIGTAVPVTTDHPIVDDPATGHSDSDGPDPAHPDDVEPDAVELEALEPDTAIRSTSGEDQPAEPAEPAEPAAPPLPPAPASRPAVTSSLAPAALTRPPALVTRARTGPPDARPATGPVRRGLLDPTPDLEDDDREPVSMGHPPVPVVVDGPETPDPAAADAGPVDSPDVEDVGMADGGEDGQVGQPADVDLGPAKGEADHHDAEAREPRHDEPRDTEARDTEARDTEARDADADDRADDTRGDDVEDVVPEPAETKDDAAQREERDAQARAADVPPLEPRALTQAAPDAGTAVPAEPVQLLPQPPVKRKAWWRPGG